MEIKRLYLKSPEGIIAYMSDPEKGWQDPYGGTFTDEQLMHMDALVEEGRCDHRGWRDVRLIVEL